MDPEPMRLAIHSLGLLRDGEEAVLTPLTGGIASDIWKVDLPCETVCIKRALHRLKVKADWFVPIERNLYEWLYYEIADRAAPGSAPRLIARDTEAYLFVMEYLEPAEYPLWKNQLRDGVTDAQFAAEVGRRLATIHSYTAARPEVGEQFPTDAIFYASRMESYLEAIARRYPDLEPYIVPLIHATMHTKHALVHGDVSPKNILNGPRGPVLLDPECAFYGDPAFDLAFCLNHLMLKCLWTPAAREGFFALFRALKDSYLSLVDWEPPDGLEARTARLLPGLFLARIDGKSPVEYITSDEDKETVRRTARRLLLHPVPRLREVADTWWQELGG
ncbi:MAG TPA: aminoglycoside phosphotransferase family protein [Candidatus Hydrogenedentes bacterium]|nr:aminoglycoside phosphotransferase family protein [Candidatus Hydrogenedentota bacterium]